MIAEVPVLIEVSYKEYKENLNSDKVTYFRQFVLPKSDVTPEEIADLVQEYFIDNNHNTDYNKYYKIAGIIASQAGEKEKERVNRIAISN